MLSIDPLLRMLREVRSRAVGATVESQCELRRLRGVPTSETVALGAWLRAQTMFNIVGMGNTDQVQRQLSNFLKLRFGSEAAVCNAEIRASLNRIDFEGMWLRQAAAIGVEIFDVSNPGQALLSLRAPLPQIIKNAAAGLRLDCQTYLTAGNPSVAAGVAMEICRQLGAPGTPAPTIVATPVPLDFFFSDTMIALGRIARQMRMMR